MRCKVKPLLGVKNCLSTCLSISLFICLWLVHLYSIYTHIYVYIYFQKFSMYRFPRLSSYSRKLLREIRFAYKNQKERELASLIYSLWDFCECNRSLLITSPVPSDGIIHSHNDAFTGITVLFYMQAPAIYTFAHIHTCDFWAKEAGPNGLLISAIPGPEVAFPMYS